MSADLLLMRGGTGLSDKSTCNAFLPLSLKGSRRKRERAPVMRGGTGLSDKLTCNAFLPLSLRERGLRHGSVVSVSQGLPS